MSVIHCETAKGKAAGTFADEGKWERGLSDLQLRSLSVLGRPVFFSENPPSFWPWGPLPRGGALNTLPMK